MSRSAARPRRVQPQDAVQIALQRDLDKSAHIRDVVLQAGRDLRQRHPWLRHQNTIGATILALALTGMVLSGWAYLAGAWPAWACIVATAFCASLTHELEHDLIHLMYFRQRPWAHRLMMVLVWVARPNTINPFIRRHLHLHHHKQSGTPSDLEERAITNGVRWTPLRLLMMLDQPLGSLLHLRQIMSADRQYKALQHPSGPLQRWLLRLQSLIVYSPLGGLYFFPLYAFVLAHGAQVIAPGLGWTLPAWASSPEAAHALAMLDAYAVVYVLPNCLRSFCLFFVSSNLHYYGDIAPHNPMQQTQVLNPWWMLPLQAFCFNFGSTHAIHHFAVKEPFYIRQWTAPTAHRVMREMGVRFNDLGTFRRANRWSVTA